MAEKQNYNTKARKCILEYLENCSDTTACVSDILDYLAKKGISVNLTTVYRYLNKLTQEKRLIKFAGENGQGAVYQLVEDEHSCDEHLHIQCSKCGKLIHLDCGFMSELKNHLRDNHSFNIKCSGSILYGICSDCETK